MATDNQAWESGTKREGQSLMVASDERFEWHGEGGWQGCNMGHDASLHLEYVGLQMTPQRIEQIC